MAEANSLMIALEIVGGVLLVIVGWNVKTLYSRMTSHEEKLTKHEDETRGDVKALYRHANASAESLRKDINALSESLRKEISKQGEKTNNLLLRMVEKNGA